MFNNSLRIFVRNTAKPWQFLSNISDVENALSNSDVNAYEYGLWIQCVFCRLSFCTAWVWLFFFLSTFAQFHGCMWCTCKYVEKVLFLMTYGYNQNQSFLQFGMLVFVWGRYGNTLMETILYSSLVSIKCVLTYNMFYFLFFIFIINTNCFWFVCVLCLLCLLGCLFLLAFSYLSNSRDINVKCVIFNCMQIDANTNTNTNTNTTNTHVCMINSFSRYNKPAGSVMLWYQLWLCILVFSFFCLIFLCLTHNHVFNDS